MGNQDPPCNPTPLPAVSGHQLFFNTCLNTHQANPTFIVTRAHVTLSYLWHDLRSICMCIYAEPWWET